MKNLKISTILNGEESTINFGKLIASNIKTGVVIYLLGNLGAGKTTLVRGLLMGLGYNGKVKSPTYAIVEQYQNLLEQGSVYHFDLYRLGSPEELEFLGIRDYIADKDSVFIVEWPDKGKGFLPDSDVIFNFLIDKDSRTIEAFSLSSLGDKLLDEMHKDIATNSNF